MRYHVVAIHLVGGRKHEHIAEVQVENVGPKSREKMVDFLLTYGNSAYVSDGLRAAEIKVVDASPRYIRTRADGVWTDNLLALPEY